MWWTKKPGEPPHLFRHRVEAIAQFAGEEPYELMGGWSLGETLPVGTLGVLGVVQRPPAHMPVDLRPKPGSKWSRDAVRFMREHPIGIIYRTTLAAVPTD